MPRRPSPYRGPSYFDQTTPSNIPIPDPSEITSREITKAKDELRDEFSQKLASDRELSRYRYEERTRTLDAFEKALEQQAKTLRDEIDEKLHGVGIRFATVEMRFSERDLRNRAMQEASAEAIAAALASQKELSGIVQRTNTEAIQKSENAFTARIGALEALLLATKDSFTTRLVDISSRIDRFEGSQKGVDRGVAATQTSVTTVLGIVGGVVAVLALLATVVLTIISPRGAEPTPIGIDSKRVDDLVSQMTASQAATNARLDALSNRLNLLGQSNPIPSNSGPGK